MRRHEILPSINSWHTHTFFHLRLKRLQFPTPLLPQRQQTGFGKRNKLHQGGQRTYTKKHLLFSHLIPNLVIPPLPLLPVWDPPSGFFFFFSLFSVGESMGIGGRCTPNSGGIFSGCGKGREEKSGVCGVVAEEGGMGTDFSVAFSSLVVVAEITLAVVYTGCPGGKERRGGQGTN